MHFACDNGHFEIVKLLLEQPDIDINNKNILFLTNLLYFFFVFMNFVLFLLISNEIYYKSFHQTPLHFAAQNNHYDIVELLINREEIEINCRTILFLVFILF